MKLYHKILTPVMLLLALLQTVATMEMKEIFSVSDVYCTLTTRDGRVWCGTKNGLYFSEKGGRMIGRPLPSLYRHPHPSVYALAYDSVRGRLWIGGWDQLYCYNLLDKHYVDTDGLRFDMTVAMRVLPDGSVEADTHRGRYLAQLSDSVNGGKWSKVNNNYYPKRIDDNRVSEQVSRYDNRPFYLSIFTAGALWIVAIMLLLLCLKPQRRNDACEDDGQAVDEEPHKAGGEAQPVPAEAEQHDDDVQFMARLAAVVDAHMSDADFSIEQMAFEMALSRAQLFRKLKLAAASTPMAYLTERRMKKAAELLRLPGANIAEVSEQVGFSDVSNFRRAFVRKYGVSPKEFADKANASVLGEE